VRFRIEFLTIALSGEGYLIMKIRKAQDEFGKFLPILMQFIHSSNYTYSLGDARARPEDERHIKNSNHYSGLAIDLNLFKNGIWLKNTEDHAEFGKFWESLHPNCRWGGRWSDGNHYEFLTEPRKEE